MNEQLMMRPPPYPMWAAPHPPAMEPPPGFLGVKPPRSSWKRASRQQHWKRNKAPPPPAGARRQGGSAAPRNTTSFLIRAKHSGGLASLVSPCPVTPAVLPTPQLSPAREFLVEMAKEAWGVDGYGSMKGLIRLRSQADGAGVGGGGVEDDSGSGSGESDLEEHVEVERRLDHDLSRFEMLQLPAAAASDNEEEEEDEEARAARLEEENLTLRGRLFLIERDMTDLRRRLLAVEDLCRNRDGYVVDASASASAAPSESVAGEQEDAMEN